MSERWYLARQGQRHGPYPQEQVRAMLASGQLLPDDHLLLEGTTQWLSLEQVRAQLDPPQPLSWKNATPDPEPPPVFPPVLEEAPPPTAPASPPTGWWPRLWAETSATASATAAQAARWQRYAGLCREQRERRRKAEAAQIAFGERLYVTGKGDPAIHGQLAVVDQEIVKAEGEKKSTRALSAQRRQLLLELAEPLLTQVMPVRGVEVEHHRALETWLESQKQVKLVADARKELTPKDPSERRRVWVGTGTLIGLLLLLLLLVLWLVWPRNREPLTAGPGQPKHSARERPDFSKVDYSIPPVDYTKGPNGQAVEPKEVREAGGDRVVSEVYHSEGRFISHGKTVVYRGDSDRIKSVSWYARGLRHGKLTEWFPDDHMSVAGAYKHGDKHGVWRQFFPGNKPRDEEQYFEGALHGPRRAWFENGQMSVEEVRIQGLRQGPYKSWTEDGRLVLELEFLDDVPQFRPRAVTREQFRALVEVTANRPERGYSGRLNLRDGVAFYLKVFGKPDSGFQEVTDWTVPRQQSWRYECRDGPIVLEVELTNPLERFVFIRKMVDG